MVTMEIKDEHLRKILARGTKLALSGVMVVWASMDMVGLHVLRRAMKRAPIKKGTLRREGKSGTQWHGSGIMTWIEFGGLAAAYAEVQHTRKDYVHPKGGTDHYLYGEPYSAWNTPEERMAQQIVEKAMLAAYRKAFRGV